MHVIYLGQHCTFPQKSAISSTHFPQNLHLPNNAPTRQNHPFSPKNCENSWDFAEKDCENIGDFAEKDCEEMKIFPIFVPK